MTEISAMSEQDPNSNGDIEKDFQSTGRTGRRNALADVLGAHKDVSTSDLPLKLEKLSTNDVPENSDSKQNNCTTENEKDECKTSSSSSSS
ncbi:hypothetical protein V9T40_009113 [Parthenolecanium corni]|uniref:cAMP-dependent protein kinase inhibitor n=1 Tax=Parthenolecanium corni TaxID=536013 RepID=A0AAN9TMY9_9HEMI